jgi:hypothetical protein
MAAPCTKTFRMFTPSRVYHRSFTLKRITNRWTLPEQQGALPLFSLPETLPSPILDKTLQEQLER